ncbi:hypothetical protein ALC56_02898 [Trachymyrmex septentrionalis]|uniref:Uncharacterized protein n=1 Tax=Trachymyrmex septentrionalis TaxID=34720 RepID=A0A151JZR0_9HYME|nr:hypothetical protein ALC56_02898 [Trachymyrmex septentrionalis]
MLIWYLHPPLPPPQPLPPSNRVLPDPPPPSTQSILKRQSLPPLPPPQSLSPPQQKVEHELDSFVTRTRCKINNRESLVEFMLDFLLLFGGSILADRDFSSILPTSVRRTFFSPSSFFS